MGIVFDHVQWLLMPKHILDGATIVDVNVTSTGIVFPVHVSPSFTGTIGIIHIDSHILVSGSTKIDFQWEMNSFNSGTTVWTTISPVITITQSAVDNPKHIFLTPTTPNNLVPFDLRMHITNIVNSPATISYRSTSNAIRVTGESTT